MAIRGERARILVVGDTGAGPDRVFAGMARVHAAEPIDALLVLGDNFYPCGVPSENDPRWEEIRSTFSTLGVPIYPLLGNHDYGEPVRAAGAWTPCQNADPQSQLRASATVPHWSFTARTYLLHSKVVDIAMLDTSPLAYGFDRPFLGSATAGGEVAQLRGMLQQMSANASRWRIVAGHHTITSSGFHGQYPSEEKSRMQALLPLLRENAVDLYISGHDHDLELIDSRPRTLVSGAGSDPRPLIRIMLRTLYPPDTQKRLGFAVVDLTPYQLSITFYDHRGEALARPFTFPKVGTAR
jgi:tartrate-resistant acid phosphatase type 5